MEYNFDLYKEKAIIFKALAHPTRLYIVERIFSDEMCVSDIMEGLDVDISTVSRHLSVLKNAGIVQDERRGTMVFYRLIMPCVLEVLSCVAHQAHERSVARSRAASIT